MITLIIVDVQNDFLTGSLIVKNAKKILEPIKEFIKTNKDKIEKILFTADWHPYNHCSFTKFGGKWPSHCVQFTPGACIEPKLLKYVQASGIPYEVDTKGVEGEQYGAFEDIDFLQDACGGRYYFDSIVSAYADSEFVICGIAGDYCVKATIENLIKSKIYPQVLINCIASIDDGTTLKEFIENNNLKVIE